MSVRNDFSTDINYDDYLEEGEHILWSQTAENKKLHLKEGIVPVVLGAGFTIMGICMAIISGIFAGLILITLGLLLLFASFERSAAFLLTDKRIIVFKDRTKKEIRYYYISFLTVERKKNSDAGNINICISYLGHHDYDSYSSSPDYKVRVFATLYDVQDCKRVEEIIKEQKNLPNAYEKARQVEREQGF